MRINIICLQQSPPSKQLFLDAADKEKVNIRYINPLASPPSNYKDEIVLFRASGSNNHEKISQAISFFDSIPSEKKIDSAKGLYLCSDKIAQTGHALYNDILMPKTIIVRKDKIEKHYDFPCVIKKKCDFGGEGVFKANSFSELQKIIAEKFSSDEEFILQEFLENHPAQDLRVYVVGGECARGIARKAAKNEFRCNTKQGSVNKPIVPSNDLAGLAIRISKIFKMDLSAIDFIAKNNQYYFLEINDTFGLNGNKDLALDIMRYIKKRFS
jgi:glutathione synthase/RimK-type ligase-like ATP-grasp enzyme